MWGVWWGQMILKGFLWDGSIYGYFDGGVENGKGNSLPYIYNKIYIMASYTGDQLSGAGTPIEALNASTAYTFSISPSSNLSGSSYFTFETVRNSDGYYDSSSALNAVGDFSSLTNVQTLVSSSYIFSLVVEEGGGSFVFTPSNNVLVSGSFLRTTGGSSLVIS